MHNEHASSCFILPLQILSSSLWLYIYTGWLGFGPEDFVHPQSEVGRISSGGFCTMSCKTDKGNQRDMRNCEFDWIWLKGATQPQEKSDPNKILYAHGRDIVWNIFILFLCKNILIKDSLPHLKEIVLKRFWKLSALRQKLSSFWMIRESTRKNKRISDTLQLSLSV